MSTGGTSFNAGTADFYAGLGITRVVLDRQLTAREIRDITLNIRSGVQCEIFILREGCGGFIDGFCTFFHCMETEKHFLNEKMETIFSYHARPYSRGCSYFFDNAVDVCDARTGRPAGRTLDYRKSPANRYDPLCRLCDLYALRDCPVKSLKIVGRGTDNGTVLRSVRTVAKARAYCRKGALNEQQYRQRSRELIREFLGKSCAGKGCYFPPVWGRQ
jgi:collagenase-like PrtC family protease